TMLKRLMPRSLFGRALIIIVTPVVLLQLVAAVVFFERHLQSVTKRLARSVAGDVAYVVGALEAFPDPAGHARVLGLANRTLNIGELRRSGEPLPAALARPQVDTLDRALHGTGEEQPGRRYSLQWR